ncbi:MAG: LIM domain-containing protein, partial [Ignavibacteria bacterium]|nr:LIM domain-containing protein [Ignavibacteria bacterium]
MLINVNQFRILQLLFILNASILFGQSVICTSCNKEIEGDYIKVGNQYFHPEHFVCDYCKKPLPAKFMSDNSKYYHSECYAEVKGLICEYCKKFITDEYMNSNNKKYHKVCYEQISPKCRVCDKTLVGTYSVDYYGNKYHSYHESEFPRCTCCNRLISKSITNGGRNYPDGRRICNICFPDAIFDQARITGLLEKVRSKLSSMGISISSAQISISGVSQLELKKVAEDYFSNDVKGFCETSILTTNKNQTKYSHKIYI